MKISINEVIRITSNLSVLGPLIWYLLKIRNFPMQHHIIGALVCLSFGFDLVGFVRFNNSHSTILLINLYYFLLHCLLAYYYYEVIFRHAHKWIFIVSMAIFLLTIVIVSGFYQSIFEYQSYLWASSAVILTIYGFSHTNHQLKSPPVLDPHFKSTLYINGGIVFYFSFSFCLFAIDQYLLKNDPEMIGLTWSFHNINNIIKNIALALGLHHSGKWRLPLTEEEITIIKRRYPNE